VKLGSPINAKSNTLSITDTNAFKLSPQRFYQLVVLP
jgi:hypothetical protein